jgi:hypothetical protein
MTSSDVERLNERAVPLGYQVQQLGDDLYLHRIDEAGHMHRSTPVEVAEAIHQLEAAEHWRLDLYGGSVDYDTTTLMIIPRDGSQPYHLSEVGGHSGSINRKTDGSGANYLYIASTARPARGGSWHKWTGGV